MTTRHVCIYAIVLDQVVVGPGNPANPLQKSIRNPSSLINGTAALVIVQAERHAVLTE
jgi:hypothetical protein